VDGDLLLGLCDNDTKSYFGLTSRHAKKLMKNIEFWRAIGDLDNKNGNQLRKVMMEVFELEEELQVLKHVAKIKDREIAKLRSQKKYYKDLLARVVLNPEQQKILDELEERVHKRQRRAKLLSREARRYTTKIFWLKLF
jgi:chaperonin cofactor prefoldin